MHRLRFGDSFELDPGAYQLRRSGQTLKLERIPMEILLLLTQRLGELVTREQIVERIWGKDINLDVDNSINGAIRKIRQVLKDDPEHPRFIQTVTGRGYRFIAPVQDAAQLTGAVAEPVTPPSPPRPRMRVWLAAGLALVVLGGAGAVMVSRTRAAAERRMMVAVLPFVNLTGDARQEYFSDGLTEEMITQLGERDPEHLGVIARTSVMHYKTDRPGLDQIARELGLQYVLEGSVRRDANHVRITAQLIRVGDQSQLWARQYDRTPADLLTLQNEIAQAIASEIEASLGRPVLARAASDSVLSAHAFAAYDLYLRGMFALNKRTSADLAEAIRYFEEATAKDPTFARAYAALADAEVLLAGYSGVPPRSLDAKARAAVLRALELDPSSAEAHTAFALIVQVNDLDWRTAEQEFRRAIALNPNYATAHHWYAEHLMWRGHFDDALRESERARQLDPLSLIIAADNGVILYCARRYDQAMEKWRSVLRIDPDFPRAHQIIMGYLQKGMYDSARADVEAERPVTSPPGVYWAAVASIDARAGRKQEARAELQQLLQSMQRHPIAAVYVAGAYLGFGDKEQTFAWLERAYAEDPSELIAINADPIFDPVRPDPRFQRLLARLGFNNQDAPRVER